MDYLYSSWIVFDVSPKASISLSGFLIMFTLGFLLFFFWESLLCIYAEANLDNIYLPCQCQGIAWEAQPPHTISGSPASQNRQSK